VRIFFEELTVQPQERNKQETVLQQKKKGEEEENQDHEFALCFDIFLHLNIIFQYHE
jgi:hypothetical protein